MTSRVFGGRVGGLLPGRGGWLAALAALALIAAAAPSCSVVVDGSAQQCSTNEDCADFPGTECSDGICKTPDVACVTNAECAGIEGGACIDGLCLANQNTCQSTADCGGEEYVVCKRPVRGKRECVSLLSAECTLVEGDWASDDAVFIGSVLPTTGDQNTSTGISTQNGSRLAIREISENASGLPAIAGGSGSRRPLVLVSCSDGSDKAIAVTAARYLVDTIGVQAIIGASFSGITLEVANQVTIPSGVLLMSPSATTAAITDLVDSDPACIAACAGDVECEAACTGLVWRTSPSDVIQSAALAAYMPFVEAKVRMDEDVLETDDIKVAILHKGDSYGQGIAASLEEQLEFNGAKATAAANSNNYLRFNYGNRDDAQNPNLRYAEAVEAAKQLGAHVIFNLGTEESVLDVLVPIEEQWDNPDYRPFYLLGDGGLIEELRSVVDDAPAADNLRDRIRGTVPGTSTDENPLFSTFVSSFESTFGGEVGGPTVFGAAGAYDITYLFAFAYAAAGSQPLTGTNLAQGLVRTAPPGQLLRIGPSTLNTGFGVMGNPNGGNLDVQGASGALDFDVSTGEASSDILIWCMATDPNGDALLGDASGRLYVATESAISGTEDNCD